MITEVWLTLLVTFRGSLNDGSPIHGADASFDRAGQRILIGNGCVVVLAGRSILGKIAILERMEVATALLSVSVDGLFICFVRPCDFIS